MPRQAPLPPWQPHDDPPHLRFRAGGGGAERKAGWHADHRVMDVVNNRPVALADAPKGGSGVLRERLPFAKRQPSRRLLADSGLAWRLAGPPVAGLWCGPASGAVA